MASPEAGHIQPLSPGRVAERHASFPNTFYVEWSNEDKHLKIEFIQIFFGAEH